jgi:hypothetical protein
MLREIAASDFVKQLYDNISINYKDVEIIGDIYLDKIKIISCPIKIQNSVINGAIVCADIIFKDEINFDNVIFRNKVLLIGKKFKSKVRIINSVFNNDVYISATFEKSVQFDASKFNKIMVFNSDFFQDLSFQKVKFRKETKFKKNTFYKTANFIGDYFRESVIFRDTVFKGEAEFGWTQFGYNACFDNVQFEDIAVFSKSFFGGLTNFNRVKFNDAEFFDIMFSNGLNLNSIEFEKLYLHWEAIEDKFNYNNKLMEDLISNYNKLNWSLDKEKCYYSLRNHIRRNSDLNSKLDIINRISRMRRIRVYDSLEWIISGYGLKPQRIIYSIAFIITFFGIIFYVLGGISGTETSSNSQNDPFVNAIIFSLSVFISRFPTDLKSIDLLTNCIALLEAILGWILLAIFINSINNYNNSKVKRS